MNKFNILLFIGLIGCSSPSISQNGSDASLLLALLDSKPDFLEKKKNFKTA